jgi:hypothetical protein
MKTLNRSYLTAAAIVGGVTLQAPGIAAAQQPDGPEGSGGVRDDEQR